MRLISFITILLLSPLVPPVLLAGLALVYAWWFVAYELILLAIFIDAYYGAIAIIPYYTIAAIIIVVGLEWIKPRLMFKGGERM